MAIARQSLTHGTTVTSNSQTVSVTVSAGSDRILLALIHTEVAGEQATAVTWNSQSLTQLGTGAAGTSFATAAIWYLKEASLSNATANCVATYPTGSHKNFSVAVFTGVDQTSTFRTQQTSAGNSGTSTTVTVPSVATGDYVLDVLTLDSTGHLAAVGANQSEEYDLGMTGSDRAHSSQAGADGGVMSWTWTTSCPRAQIATALIPAAGGGGGTVVRSRLVALGVG